MTARDIEEEFAGKLVGDRFMRKCVSEAILLLPEEIAWPIIKDVWFFSSTEDAFGYAFNGNDLKDKHLIFLSDVLFKEPKSQILYTILHEIGHIALKHKNSIHYTQSKEEIAKQEHEADKFAKRYLA